jgi:RND family efflux transporter MFP subunit
LCSCGKDDVQKQDVVRSVKILEIAKAIGENSRQISGVVKASDESTLSFRVGGRVSDVLVKQGDSVKKGQVIARLKQKEYILSINAAQANLSGAKSDLAEKTEKLNRQESLKKEGYASKASLEKTQNAYQAAKSNLAVKQTAFETAKDNLKYTELTAPFSGKIAERLVEPFEEVTAGKTIFSLHGDGGYQVELLMPETLISEVKYGDVVKAEFSTLKNVKIEGKVVEVGAKPETGNAYPVKIQLLDTPRELRSGMTAKVTFNYGQNYSDAVFLIPVSALDLRVSSGAKKQSKAKARVFVFNPEKQVAQERMVTIRDIRGNKLEVINGLNEGDYLIVAGVPFLSNGQKVKQWKPTYNIPAKLNF